MTTEKEKKTVEQKQDKKRDLILNGDVTESSVKDIIMTIIDINRYDDEREAEDTQYTRQPINLVVNTYGGSAYDGFALVGVIDSSTTPVHTYLYGKAMSVGLPIFAAGHKRFAHPIAILMYHQVSFGAHGTIGYVEDKTEQAKVLMGIYDDYLLHVSNLPKKKMDESKLFNRDWFFTAKEALKYGVVDVLITEKRP